MTPRLVVRAGSGLAARRGRAALFIAAAGEASAREVLQAWLAGDERALDEALFAVVRARRPDHVTPFCALFDHGSEVRVVIHGRVDVLALVGGEEVRLQGRDAASRVEEVLSGDIAAVAVAAERPELVDEPLLDLVEGVVSAGSVQLVWPAAPDSTVIGVPPPAAEEAADAFAVRPTRAIAAAPPTPSSREVEGALCAAGHFNSPDAPACRVCGRPVGEEMVRRPRPPLGRLRTQDGRECVVDGRIVIGRNPGSAPEVIDGTAMALEVPEGEKGVSRIHAEVSVDGWAVLLRDLGSANGTYILPAGVSEWFRIDAGHPIEIVPGTVIATGGFEIRFENL